jgi:hypothetical protein
LFHGFVFAPAAHAALNEVDRSYAVSADGLGNVYITGSTSGNLAGLNTGGEGPFVSKFDAAGNLLWTRQFGGNDVFADGLGNVHVAGSIGNLFSSSAYVSKYDAEGNLQWIGQFDTPTRDHGYGVAVDGIGNVYLTGDTNANSGDEDGFLTKFDASGALLWTQLDRASDGSAGVSADNSGNVYISGGTFANTGDIDAQQV